MRSLIKDKKGLDGFVSTNKSFMYILLTIVVGLLITIFAVLIVRNIGSRTSIDDSIEADFALARITNVCFTHEDSLSGNLKQNNVDLIKVTNAKLSTCFKSQFTQPMTVVVEPIYENDFLKTTAKIGNKHTSTIGFARYVLVTLTNGDVKPGIIYYII